VVSFSSGAVGNFYSALDTYSHHPGTNIHMLRNPQLEVLQ